MTEPIAEDIGILADHVKNLLQRQNEQTVAIQDIIRWLRSPAAHVQQQHGFNPVQDRSQVDIVRVTQVDPLNQTWIGARQRRNIFGHLVDSPSLPNFIGGDLGVANKIPTVGQKISVLYTGQDLEEPSLGDHSMIMTLGDTTGFRRVAGFPGETIAPGSNFTLSVFTVLEGDDPGAAISVWNMGTASYTAFDQVIAEWNNDLQRWEVYATPWHYACHITRGIDGAYYVDAETLAGSGLTTEIGAGGCLKLAVSDVLDLPANLGVRFELPAGRSRTGTVPPVMNGFVINNAGTQITTISVTDYDLRYFGKNYCRGRAIPTDYGMQITSMEDDAQFVLVTLGSVFTYTTDPPSAGVASVDRWWGPADQCRQPSIATIYDEQKNFINAKPGDKIICAYRQRSDNDYRYYAMSFQAQPQLIWPFASTGASDGDAVASSGGFYPAKLVRYTAGSPDSNSSYAAVQDISIFMVNGTVTPLKHRDRMVGFKVGNAAGTDIYAVISAGAGGTTSEPPKLVLIDKDIPGVLENTPTTSFVAGDVVLTTAETGAGYIVQLQDPPSSNYDSNHVTSLNLWGDRRTVQTLKYFISDVPPLTGQAQGSSAANRMNLAVSASSINHYYNGDTITITGGTGAGQVRTIVEYDGPSREVTVDTAFSPTVNTSSLYSISSTKNLRLAVNVIDDPTHSPPRKIVRYATTDVFYDDDEAFPLKSYQKEDYPGYPESDAFPPTGTGTYRAEAADFFKERYRGIAINGVLIMLMCKRLPPPPLTLR
jgi:hypothetical protein